MIELIDIIKKYNIIRKHVYALKNITISFPNTGLVFIIGKSGSGKTTLLNLISGMDLPDSGELLINSVSTKDFTQKAFDHYRRSDIGYVLQDYNLIEEFKVGDNIALAIELLGKTYDEASIRQILKDVDLEGYIDRKPNELSGGQQQRVAIARALIKNPNIILADEPTGALDDDTGEQIIQLLKKFSKDRLVIVVSHSRYFANQYADRIIELSEGQIVKDQWNITQDKVNVFNEKVEHSSIEKSHLPFKRSLMFVLHTLKFKKLRLFFMILLTTISFTLFGISDTLSDYDSKELITKSIIDSDVRNLAVTKEVLDLNKDYIHYNFKDDEVNRIEEHFGTEFFPVYLGSSVNKGIVDLFPLENFYIPEKLNGSDYRGEFMGFVEIPEDKLKSLGFNITGNMPVKRNEVAITKYHYENFVTSGYQHPLTKEIIEPEFLKSESDLIGKEILLNEELLVITAVIDTKVDLTRYSRNVRYGDLMFIKMKEYLNYVRYGFHSLVYRAPGTINHLIENTDRNPGLMITDFIDLKVTNDNLSYENMIDYVGKLSHFKSSNIYFFEEGKTALEPGEVLIEFQHYYRQMNWDRFKLPNDLNNHYSSYGQYILSQVIEGFYDYAQKNYVNAYSNGFTADIVSNLYDSKTLTEEEKIEAYYYFLLPRAYADASIYTGAGKGFYKNPYEETTGFEIEWRKREALYQEHVDRTWINPDYNVSFKSPLIESPNHEIKVVGYFIENAEFRENNHYMVDYMIIDDKGYNHIERFVPGPYTFMIGEMPKNQSKVRKIVTLIQENENNSTQYKMVNEVTSTISTINGFIELLASVFLYIGIGFALFTTLLLYNFISMSITIRKREIGILRTLGAKRSDIFKLFNIESMIIALINGVLAIFLTFGSVVKINSLLRNKYGMILTILNFGLRQILLILLTSIVVCSIASFIPIYRLSKKKVITILRNK